MHKPGLSLMVVMWLAACGSACWAQARVPSAGELSRRLKSDHPRLYLDAAGFEVLRERVKDPPLDGWAGRIRRRADRMINQPVSRYDRDLLQVSRHVLDGAFDLSMTYKLTGDAQYRERLWRELEAAAKFEDWNPSHFLDTAEMIHAFAVAYDWLYDDWTEAQRRTLREAIVQHGLRPGLDSYRNRLWWATSDTNWNPVCNGGLAIGALAVADEQPEPAITILRYAIRRLPLAMKRYAPDGGWAEGVGYWGYTTNYNVALIACLQSALGDDFGLSRMPGFDQTGWFAIYMVAPGGIFNFADVPAPRRIYAPQMFWLAQRFNAPEFAAYQAQRVESHVQDLIWYPPDGVPRTLSDLPLNKHFRDVAIAVMRSGWEDQAACVAFKGGSNAASHGHLDLGSFMLDALGQRWAVDLGRDNYGLPGYFDNERRWTYYRMRAEGHNTLVINPSQAPDQHPQATAPISRFRSTADGASGVVDLTGAYFPHARRVWRGIALTDERRSVLIQDELNCRAPADVWWFMHTQAKIVLSDEQRLATLSQGGQRITARLVEPADAQFSVMDAKPLRSSPAGKGQADNAGVRKLAIHLPTFTSGRIIVSIQTQPRPGAPTRLVPLSAW